MGVCVWLSFSGRPFSFSTAILPAPVKQPAELTSHFLMVAKCVAQVIAVVVVGDCIISVDD